MLLSRIDRAFRRYHRTGDPLALGRVFDAAAPELYRLAWHLVGNRHAAEDLVQTTFLVAIQDAGSFAEGNRVMPWLCGILTHRALHHRRQARGREGAVSTAPPAVAADPAALAQAEELRATVAAAVRALPDPYRQVLLLHLLHELSPKEIAEALARPDATVRVQLHRGLDLLRKALPAGVAAFARAAAPPPIGLGVVRAVVLAEAGRHGGAAAGVAITTFGGLLLMKKVLLGVALLLVLLSTWSLWPSLEPPSRRDEATGPAAATEVATVVPAASTPAVPTVRQAVPTPAGTERAVLEVLVRWADGTPAANVTVRCVPVQEHGANWHHGVGRDRELQLRAARTGDDGIARFEDLWPGKAVATADRGGSVNVELAAGAPQRYTLDVPSGFDVRGRVLDADDRPIAAATVWMSIAPGSDDSEPVATTGADGDFRIRSARQDHLLAATAPGYGCASVDTLKAERARDLWILRVRRAPGVLLGTVLDPEGRPVANARVLVGRAVPDTNRGTHGSMTGSSGPQDHWPSRFLLTDAAGTFRAEGLPLIPWPLWVGAPGFAPTWQQVELAADAATKVTVRLRQGAQIRGRATDEAGSPVARVDIRALHVLPATGEAISAPPSPQQPPLWARLYAMSDADGTFLLDHVMPGKVDVSANVWVNDNSAIARTELDVADGQAVEWNPRLQKMLSLDGSVVDEAGRPLAGWSVRFEAVLDPKDSGTMGTDAKGRFFLRKSNDEVYRFWVQPDIPDLGASRAMGEFRPGTEPLRLVVPRDALPTGTLCGQLLATDGSPCTNGSLGIYSVTSELTTLANIHSQATSATLMEDGRYQSPKLGKGRYRVQFRSEAFGFHPIGEFEVDRGITDLGVFRVPTPGRIAVTIVDSRGMVMPAATVNWWALDDLRQGGILTIREGRVSGFLRPGRHMLSTTRELPLAAIELDVRSGETTEVRFVVPDGVRFRLRVPSAASSHRGWRHLWRDDQGTTLRMWNVELDNRVEDLEVWRFAPPGRYTLEVRDADGRSATTAFDLRATDPPMVVEAPLPAAK